VSRSMLRRPTCSRSACAPRSKPTLHRCESGRARAPARRQGCDPHHPWASRAEPRPTRS
jgi:hypothetical protein